VESRGRRGKPGANADEVFDECELICAHCDLNATALLPARGRHNLFLSGYLIIQLLLSLVSINKSSRRRSILMAV
jgi:hypothetical protein